MRKSNITDGYNWTGRLPISIEPFSRLDLTDDTEVLDWVKCTADKLTDYYSSFRSLYRDNIGVYVGGSARSGAMYWDGSQIDQVQAPRKGVTNMIQPIVESHVSRLTSSRAAVSVSPVHAGEYNDLAAAKNAEEIIRMSWQDRKVDARFENAGRCMLVCGLAYMLVEWDPDIGPPIPVLEEGVPALDEDGQPIEDEDGNIQLIHPDIRIGDVNYRTLRPDQVLEQPGRWGDTTDWVITVEMEDTFRLRDKYPTIAHQIKPGGYRGQENLEMAFQDTEHQTIVFTVYHRATRQFPNGRLVVCTPDAVLENLELPYPSLNKAGMLPIARVHDTEIPGYDLPLPMTVMEAGKPYQLLHNQVNGNILRNLSLQTPKWVVNSGAGVRLTHLNNSSNIVQYKGDASQAPQLTSPRTTASEVFAYRQQLLNEIQVNTGSSHILNEPPPNTRAAAMLQHQEEQEFKRAEPLIKHMNNFQADVAMIALAIMADKYDDSDERKIKLSGHKGPSSLIRLTTADLMGPYDIKVERTSALPESKQGRLNEASRLFQMGLIDKEQYKKVIGFSSDPDLASAETKAYEKQLLENDLMMRGHEVEPPIEWEDHVEHLRALYPVIQSVEFAEYDDKIKQQYIIHAMAHEMYAWKRSQISIAYAVRVAEHVQFAFFNALPEAVPPGLNNPPTPVEGALEQRLTTPGLQAPSQGMIEPPGPGNPEAV